MQFLTGVVGLFSVWFWVLALVVLAAFLGNRFKVAPLVALWTELVAVATLVWGQAKANVLVLVVAGILFFFDQKLFVITLAVVAVIIALGDKANEIAKTIKLPKV